MSKNIMELKLRVEPMACPACGTGKRQHPNIGVVQFECGLRVEQSNGHIPVHWFVSEDSDCGFSETHSH